MALLREVEGRTPLERVLRTHPELFAHVADFVPRIWSEGLVNPVVLEICRLRMAHLLGCRSEQQLRYQPAIDAGLTEEKVAAIPSYYTSELFTEHERACLALAEAFTMDAHAVTDECFHRVAAGCSPKELSAFLCALAVFDGTARMRLMLRLADEPSAADDIVVVPAPVPGDGPVW